MEDNMFVAVIVGIGLLLALLFVARSVFSVGKQLRYQETIIELLMKIVNSERISDEQKDSIKDYLRR